MKNKFMRSVTAMVVAVTMLISSQGVVTSFADGGDHSDLSESSSVQMNEVSNNGTDQSTENDDAQCNCGVTDGEAHKEVCPLYVKPDGGNTNDGDTEDDAAQCTCGAEEGGPHKEGCPLYVKPDGGNTSDGDTDNGAGEDADIKSVVDAINALPAAETITEETDLEVLKTQVNAARAAYDALTAEQKESFDPTVLDKLTALEAKISELESGEQETVPSEAVQNVIEKIDAAVEQIDYTTETITATDGTTITKTHITMLKDLDPANNTELKALIDKEAAHEQDENQPALTDEEAAKLSDARKVFEDAKAKYLSKGFSNAPQAARQAYDALAEADKTQVTNYSLLTDMEANIAYISTLPENEYVAEVNGIKYSSLNEAVKEAAEGSTITLLKDCELTEGFNKTLTFTGHHKITIPKQLKSNGENWMCFGLGDTSRVLTFDGVEVEWIADSSVPWLMLQLNGTLSITNGAKLTFKFDSLSSGTRNALYMHPGAKLYVTNGSTFEILGENTSTMERPGQGIQLEKAGTASINVTGNSKFLIDGTNRGYVNSPSINVEDSTFTVQNCTSNASNGGNFTAINSTVTYQNNKGHGLSAGNVILENSTLTSHHNGLYGVFVSGAFNVDGTSKLTITENSYDGDYAGLNLAFNQSIALVKSGAEITINNNFCSGLSNWRTSVFEEGVKLTITGNSNYQTDESYGGGVFNYKANAHLTLPSDAVIYNNHAKAGGDDIYNTGEITFSRVGTDWILDDTNLPITGWYFDGDNNGTTTNRWSKSNYYELFNLFDESGKATLTGTYALKAAHAYSYDPETPVNPGTEWQVSKSKTATNLDANYQSQVTLSLPSSEYQLASDVVFVLDKSTSGNVKDDAIKMLESLKSDIEENGAKVNVGIVIFNQAASRFGWYDLITEYDQIIEIFNKEIKDGTNLNAGLLAAKEMLEEHTDVDPNRKHMILVSDGISYYYCEGTNYQQGYTIASLNGGDDGEGTRNCTPDSTLSAWGIKYGTYGADNEGFSYIPDWSQWESGMPALLSSDYTKYQYQVGSPDIPTEADSPKAVPFKERKNYPINVDISLYNSLKLYRDLASKYHCYAVLDGTTNKYTFGTPFMEYMAGETFVGSSSQEKFLNIKNDIFYLVDRESSIVDVIGEGIDNTGNEYDFKFINDINNLNLTVNGISLPKKQIDENTYGFGDAGDGIYDFVLTYYPDGIGKEARSQEVIAGELFRLDINVPITIDKPVQLTYTVQLTNPQTANGTYGQYDADGSEEYAGLYTNKMAILYPVDSNGVEEEQEAFQKPTVSYSISNGKPVDPPVDPEDPTPRPGGGGDEDDDTPTIINETPVPTTTIDDEDVPLTDLPEDTVTIDDEEVPLKDIPNTGDMIPVPAMVAAVISIGGIALLMKKHK